MSQEWVKSSYSSGQANCVEVRLGESVAQRDSKQAAGPVITHTREGWRTFVTSLRRGDLAS
ncbi:DUF397 domain-containing protein [Streptomyces uncialis]|uniref:Toxin n=1 Tax=Streptomyces uncialis TaxID=1048205 RepID=A0A1Q4V6G6_9ACTN|nr:DUF397 domain-containing protein [Streptomyces uncialis]OKH93458.1 toxin [Streptomyces uncialis]